METKVCLECGKEKPLRSFGNLKNIQVQKSGKQVVRRKNICYGCYSLKKKARITLDMLAAFDYKCQCCGENHPSFLTIHHLTGKGRVLGKRASVKEKQFAKKHGWDREHFSVLCNNCNCAKQYFGTCPHERNETPEQGIEKLRNRAQVKRYYVHPRFVNKIKIDAELAKIEKASNL